MTELCTGLLWDPANHGRFGPVPAPGAASEFALALHRAQMQRGHSRHIAAGEGRIRVLEQLDVRHWLLLGFCLVSRPIALRD